jgi:glycosyltransferase involved in cell wall biosynthesis
MRALLNQNYKTSNNIVHYIPHWSPIEPSLVKRFDESRLTQEWDISKKFVVQYSGNMGLWHDMNSFVRLADSFREDSSTRFIFIGDGVRKRDAEALATSLQLDNINWKPFVPLEDLEESLAACHVALISLRNHLSGIAVPCKLYGILASGRPVIAQVPYDSEIAITVTEFECGFVVPPGDDHQLVRSLNQLKTDFRLREEMGRNSHAAYVNYFTCKSVTEKLERLL